MRTPLQERRQDDAAGDDDGRKAVSIEKRNERPLMRRLLERVPQHDAPERQQVKRGSQAVKQMRPHAQAEPPEREALHAQPTEIHAASNCKGKIMATNAIVMASIRNKKSSSVGRERLTKVARSAY